MRKRWPADLIAGCLFLGTFGPGAPESGRAQDAVTSARSAISERLERKEPADKGVTFSVAITAEVLGNLAGGSNRRAAWESLWQAGLEVDCEKAAGWKGLSLSLSALYAQGFGLTDSAVHDFNTLSNIDTYDSLRLYEAWLQQEWCGGRLSIRLGQLLADAEFFVSDYGALFVNSSFGAIPLVSQNLEPPIFPVAAPGVRVRAEPLPALYLEAAIFNGEVGRPVRD